jgi:hypothetical protein
MLNLFSAFAEGGAVRQGIIDTLALKLGADMTGASGRFLWREGREAEPCADVIETNNRIVAPRRNSQGIRSVPSRKA